MKIIADETIILVLQNPREKIWGILREINHAGVFARGIDLNSFEDFVLAIAHDKPFYGLGEHFYPLWRIEKITKDDFDGDIPSMESQFKNRTGKSLDDIC